MNFSNAFRYPFRNFAKVMSIVLVMTIAIAVFIAMLINSHDWSPLLAHMYGFETLEPTTETLQPLNSTAISGIFGLLLAAVISGFWLSGYSIEVIRSIMRNEEWMPAIEFGRNLKDGFYLFVSSVAYWLLFMVLVVVLAVAASIVGSFDGFGRFFYLAAAVFALAAVCIMGWGYLVGMARYAAEGDYKASWQVWRNMRMARTNPRTGFVLLLYMIALSIIYAVVRGIVDGIFGGITGANLFAGITVSIIIYYVFNLMQHFSTQHLIAQYAVEIGIGDDRYGPDLDDEKVKYV